MVVGACSIWFYFYIFIFLKKWAAQADLTLLDSSDPPALASLVAGLQVYYPAQGLSLFSIVEF
jgi:hypothetical protein